MSTFADDLERMAQSNAPFANLEKIQSALANDIRNGDAFLNIYKGSKSDRFLILTSQGVRIVKTGLFGSKIVDSMDYTEMRDVNTRISAIREVEANELRIRGIRSSIEFPFGFHSVNETSTTQREVARKNSDSAAAEIEMLMNRITAASSRTLEDVLDIPPSPSRTTDAGLTRKTVTSTNDGWVLFETEWRSADSEVMVMRLCLTTITQLVGSSSVDPRDFLGSVANRARPPAELSNPTSSQLLEWPHAVVMANADTGFEAADIEAAARKPFAYCGSVSEVATELDNAREYFPMFVSFGL